MTHGQTVRQRPDVIAVVNTKSGKAMTLAGVDEAFASLGVAARCYAIQDNWRMAVRRQRQSGGTVVAIGGDGTVRSVAQEVAGSDLRLAVVPAGTLNHFAKDLHIPLDFTKALALIVHGKTTRIDVGSVNGHVFINNSSIGLYPTMVQERQRFEHLIGKWPAAGVSMITAIAKLQLFTIRMDTDDGAEDSSGSDQSKIRHTPFLFVGNNSYHMRRRGFLNRNDLDQGILSLYIVKTANILHITRIFLKALLGRGHQERYFETLHTQKVTLHFRKHRHRIRVAFDGEVARLRTPLCYDIRPKILRVVVPGNHQ